MRIPLLVLCPIAAADLAVFSQRHEIAQAPTPEKRRATLGPGGFLAEAGIDVYESEPEPPRELLGLDNVILTPHLAGWSPETVANLNPA